MEETGNGWYRRDTSESKGVRKRPSLCRDGVYLTSAYPVPNAGSDGIKFSGGLVASTQTLLTLSDTHTHPPWNIYTHI